MTLSAGSRESPGIGEGNRARVELGLFSRFLVMVGHDVFSRHRSGNP